MKNVIFLFALMFSPVVLKPAGSYGNLERDKMEKGIADFTPKIIKVEPVDSLALGIKTLSNWQVANGSFYDPKDSSQTKDNCDGVGSFGRPIQSGSIALGSAFTKFFLKKKDEFIWFLEIKDSKVMTPFGKGIFRLDDTMNKRFSSSAKVYSLDLNRQDLKRSDWLEEGKTHLVFRIFKVIKKADINT